MNNETLTNRILSISARVLRSGPSDKPMLLALEECLSEYEKRKLDMAAVQGPLDALEAKWGKETPVEIAKKAEARTRASVAEAAKDKAVFLKNNDKQPEGFKVVDPDKEVNFAPPAPAAEEVAAPSVAAEAEEVAAPSVAAEAVEVAAPPVAKASSKAKK